MSLTVSLWITILLLVVNIALTIWWCKQDKTLMQVARHMLDALEENSYYAKTHPGTIPDPLDPELSAIRAKEAQEAQAERDRQWCQNYEKLHLYENMAANLLESGHGSDLHEILLVSLPNNGIIISRRATGTVVFDNRKRFYRPGDWEKLLQSVYYSFCPINIFDDDDALDSTSDDMSTEADSEAEAEAIPRTEEAGPEDEEVNPLPEALENSQE